MPCVVHLRLVKLIGLCAIITRNVRLISCRDEEIKMSGSLRKSWQAIAYPYNFALKQGIEIKKDPLDYSLMIMRVSPNETLPSPNNEFYRGKEVAVRAI